MWDIIFLILVGLVMFFPLKIITPVVRGLERVLAPRLGPPRGVAYLSAIWIGAIAAGASSFRFETLPHGLKILLTIGGGAFAIFATFIASRQYAKRVDPARRRMPPVTRLAALLLGTGAIGLAFYIRWWEANQTWGDVAPILGFGAFFLAVGVFARSLGFGRRM